MTAANTVSERYSLIRLEDDVNVEVVGLASLFLHLFCHVAKIPAADVVASHA
jgi:hypothetical protein